MNLLTIYFNEINVEEFCPYNTADPEPKSHSMDPYEYFRLLPRGMKLLSFMLKVPEEGE